MFETFDTLGTLDSNLAAAGVFSIAILIAIVLSMSSAPRGGKRGPR